MSLFIMNKSEAGKLGYAKVLDQLKAYSFKKSLDARARHANLNPKCKHCQVPLVYEKRSNTYCSKSCAASVTNIGKEKKNGTCHFCKAPCSNRRKFCDSCKHWGSSATSLEEATTDKARKKYLLKVRGHRCEMCATATWRGQPVPLVLDHINGDSSCNTKNNLRLICPNCDAQTPFYKNKNKGRGREYRRKRYARMV